MDITEKLETIKHRWEEIGEQLADHAAVVPYDSGRLRHRLAWDNMGRRLEIYTNEKADDETIAIANEFNIDSQIIGYVGLRIGNGWLSRVSLENLSIDIEWDTNLLDSVC